MDSKIIDLLINMETKNDNILIKSLEIKIKYLEEKINLYKKNKFLKKNEIEKLEKEKFELYQKLSDELDIIYKAQQ